VAERTGLNLTNLTPAEEKIVEAVSEYAAMMKREGKDATRTLLQVRLTLIGTDPALPK
jgi:hypothetical protein